MANTNITGTGAITTADYHSVTWTGTTKGGNAVIITLENAINLGNIEWTFAEKDDTIANVVFTSCYTNTDAASTSTAEAWKVEYADGTTAGAGEIVLGAGVFAIDGTDIALTRGGGSFKVEREFRNINADGDRGAVKGRIVMDASTATLELNALTMLTSVASLYAAVNVQ